MRSILTITLLSLPLSLSACKKDGDTDKPSVVDGIASDVDSEVKGADESWDKTVEDVKGAGDDISDAVSSDDDDADDDGDDDAESSTAESSDDAEE